MPANNAVINEKESKDEVCLDDLQEVLHPKHAIPAHAKQEAAGELTHAKQAAAAFMNRFDARLGNTITVAENLKGAQVIFQFVPNTAVS